MHQSAKPPLASPGSLNRAGIWIPFLMLLLGLLVTAAAVHQAHRFVDQERQVQFNAQLTRMRNDLAVHVYRNIDVLRTYQAEISTHRVVSLTALMRIAQVLELDTRFPGIASIGYLASAAPDPARDDSPDVRVLYLAESATALPGAGADEAPLRREAIGRARDTGDIAATAPVGPGSGADSPDTFMVYLPIYRSGVTPASVPERRREFQGAIFLTLRPAQLMAGLFDRHRHPGAHIRLHFDGYAQAPPVDTRAIQVYDNEQPTTPDVLRTRVPLTLAGTLWSLEVGMYDTEQPRLQYWLPWAALALGLLLTLLGTLAIDILRRSRLLSLQRASQDRSRRREAEAALHLRQRAIEASANAIVIANAREAGYPVEYVNPAFERMTGYSAQEILGKSLRVMHATDTGQKGLEDLQRILRDQTGGQVVLRNYRKNGQLYWTRLHIAPVRDDAGDITHFVAAKYDITETRRYQEKLEYQAYHDALTHLPNRHMLRRRLHETIKNSGPGDPPFWVAFLDLDNFKLVNDTLGHTLGDLVLQRIAQRLRESLHEGDIVARRGGDEFVFILFDREAPRGARSTLHRIMTAVSRPMRIDAHRFFLSCSIGIAVHPQDGSDPELLIKHADMAMYHAKEQGRNNFQFFTPALQTQATERVRLEGDLRAALANQEFELHYQPQVDLRDGGLIGVEALVRWRHPERGLVPPAHFIPMAEETGLIVPLGEWILRTACRQASLWRNKGLPPFRVAVNLSPRQFNDERLPMLVDCMLREHLLPSQWLELEITETMLMTDVDIANTILHKLKSRGVMLSLDDFGTGYSSLAQLKRFPLDIIKIDRSFIADVTTDPDDAAIVRTIIKLAHNLEMKAVAEGVETVEQQAFLREHDCDAMQGYLVNLPLPAAELEKWMRGFQRAVGHAL